MKNLHHSLLKRALLAGLLLFSLLILAAAPGCGPLRPPGSLLDREEAQLQAVKEAWDAVTREHIDKDKLDHSDLSRAAIEGMLQSLDDPYATYLSPRDYQLEISDLHGKFEGIGAELSIRENHLMIVAPRPGSPAEGAGIRPGDKILEIDGLSTTGMGLGEATLKIRGAKGTRVQLLILHQGEENPVTITIVRQEIQLTSVSSRMIGDIAYISIHFFSTRTDKELEPIVGDLAKDGARGIVLDLRNNGGGVVDTTVNVAGYFLKEGIVVYLQDNEGKRTPLHRIQVAYTTDLPLVVLINGFSASASEILAGAIHDAERGALMGTKSFGKGSYNTFRALSDGSAIYFTIGRWITPGGNLIEGKGLVPDIELDLEGEALVERAVEYLHSKIGSTPPQSVPAPATTGR